jgi:predicted DNA-binding transcriptional regulator AlpA
VTKLLRLLEIIGDKKADPPIPGRFPVSRASWWQGIREGKYPPPLALGPKTRAWLETDIERLVAERIAAAAADHAAASERGRKLVEARRRKHKRDTDPQAAA